MKKLKYIILFPFIFMYLAAEAQTRKERKNDQMSYYEIIKKFEKKDYKTIEVKRKLAESYYKTGDYFKAEDYYAEIAESNESNSEDIYNYAYILAVNEQYSESENRMEVFYKLVGNDSRAKLHVENKGFYNILLQDKEQFKIKNIDMNSEAQDFGTSYYDDKVVFASSKTKLSFIKRIRTNNKLLYLDLYVADNIRGKLQNIKPFDKLFNKKYHDGPASFSDNGNFIAYTRNNYEGKSYDELVKLQIYTSEKKGGIWQIPNKFGFNNDDYSVMHPTLTADGKTMFFASDMPGGYGGFDIFKTERNEQGIWSKPKNLGKIINTEGNEVFPFIHNEGLLFFASDGLLTLGGLDIFYTKEEQGNYLEPKNIGVPVNSNRDDFAFILDKKMKRGFFSSDRDEGKGNDDIYSFKLLKEFKFDVIIKGKTIDENGQLLSNAYVSIYDGEGNIIEVINSDGFGNFEFIVSPSTEWKLKGVKPKYITDIKTVKPKPDKRIYEQNLTLSELPKFVIFCYVTDKQKNFPLSDVNVFIKDNNSGKETDARTYDTGDLLYKLTEYKLNDSIDFSLKFRKEGYASKKIDIAKFLNSYGNIKLKIKMQKIEIGKDLGKILDINPIYFDYDKSNIRSDAAVELDKIVNIMNEYPNMVIELSSHTDCRGTSIYNLKLSDRRAKASAHYIKTRITNPTRIYGDGYGETKLINDCACEGSNKSGCSEEEHQQNRRTEFKIIRI